MIYIEKQLKKSDRMHTTLLLEIIVFGVAIAPPFGLPRCIHLQDSDRVDFYNLYTILKFEL